MGKLGMMRGTNLLSSEIDFRTSGGAGTSVQFDEAYAPELFAGACYVKGLYITEWTAAKLDGGIKIQNGTSTTQSSNTDIITLDLSNATSPGNMAKSFTFSGGLQISDGLHIAATADYGASSIVKVRVLYEPIGGAGAAGKTNLAAHSQPNMQVSSEISHVDSASGTAQFADDYSVKIVDDPCFLHTLIITEWAAAAQTDGGIDIQNGISTTIGSNSTLIRLDLSNKSTTEDMAKCFDFPGGIYCDKGLHISASADLYADNGIKFQAIYEVI